MTRTSTSRTRAGVAPASWEDALTGLEAQLARFDSAIVGPDAEVLEPHAWSPPEGLGPLPPELRRRAEGLLDRLRGAAVSAGEELDALRSDGQDVDRRRRAGSAYAGLVAHAREGAVKT